MPKVNKFLRACYKAVGTKYHHQGRKPGVGLDCIGLVVSSMKIAGYNVVDNSNYSRRPDGKSLKKALDDYCNEVSFEDVKKGDILLFTINNRPCHVAVYCDDNRIIHSWATARKVCEVTLTEEWINKISGVYRLKEI